MVIGCPATFDSDHGVPPDADAAVVCRRHAGRGRNTLRNKLLVRFEVATSEQVSPYIFGSSPLTSHGYVMLTKVVCQVVWCHPLLKA